MPSDILSKTVIRAIPKAVPKIANIAIPFLLKALAIENLNRIYS